MRAGIRASGLQGLGWTSVTSLRAAQEVLSAEGCTDASALLSHICAFPPSQ